MNFKYVQLIVSQLFLNEVKKNSNKLLSPTRKNEWEFIILVTWCLSVMQNKTKQNKNKNKNKSSYALIYEYINLLIKGKLWPKFLALSSSLFISQCTRCSERWEKIPQAMVQRITWGEEGMDSPQAIKVLD